MDTQPFMHYSRGSNKATPLGPLGKKVQNTAKWADMTQTLKDVCQHLREFQDDPTLEKSPTRGKCVRRSGDGDSGQESRGL